MRYNEQRIPYVSALSGLMGLANGCSVGLKVTSLKWTGPDPEGLETPPKIPEKIEYRDAVSRFADMGFEGEENGLGGRDDSGMSPAQALNSLLTRLALLGSFNEATQDIAERQKLQRMIPVRAEAGSYKRITNRNRHRGCPQLRTAILFPLNQSTPVPHLVEMEKPRIRKQSFFPPTKPRK